MRKRLEAIFLLWVCMIMQAVSVFPHHHHDNALCFHQDKDLTQTPAPHTCSSSCVTQFNLPSLSCKVVKQEPVRVSKHDSLCSVPYDLSEIQDGGLRHKLKSCVHKDFLYNTIKYDYAGRRAPPLGLSYSRISIL